MAVLVPKTDQELAALAPVQSVAGRTGSVTLSTSDISGLGTIATQAASSVTITGGSISGITDLPVADGGTGSSTAAGARTNLGLVIGSDVLSPTGNGSALTGITSSQISGLGTMSSQSSTSVSITGGSIAGITDISVADGGTGASTAAGARTNLGLVIGTDVLAPTGNGSGLTGLTNTQISGLGTMSTQSSSSVSITGGSITGITDLAVADGGTGSSTAAGARTNLGLVIGTDVLAPTGNGSSLTGITQSQVSGLTTTLATKADLVGGVVPSSQIPSVAITEFLGSVSSQSAMTALSGQKGDWCIRTDAQMAYFIVGDDPTIAANWTAIPHPSSPVLTVNGQTGTVVLGYADVGAQASDATLTGLASVVTAADKLIYASGSDTFTTCDLTSTARTLLDDTSTSAMRTTLGLGSIATQDSSSVSITGGSITGITDLAVADGGTGASDASTARTNLGLVIGTDVLAPNGSGASLTGITATQVGLGSVTNDAQTKASVVPNTAPTAGQILVGNAGGTAYGVVSASGDATISSTGAITLTNDSSTRSNLGLGSMATQSSSSVSITGGSITGITDLPVADGGTGASTAATARSNLGVAVSNNNWFDSAPAVGTITWVSKSRVAFTIGGVYGVKTTSGTCTFAVKINGTAVTGLSAVAATSSTQDVTASGGNSVAIGDAITIEYTAASSPVNLCFTLEATR